MTKKAESDQPCGRAIGERPTKKWCDLQRTVWKDPVVVLLQQVREFLRWAT
jgi:hypothetical protein